MSQATAPLLAITHCQKLRAESWSSSIFGSKSGEVGKARNVDQLAFASTPNLRDQAQKSTSHSKLHCRAHSDRYHQPVTRPPAPNPSDSTYHVGNSIEDEFMFENSHSIPVVKQTQQYLYNIIAMYTDGGRKYPIQP